MSYTPGTKPAVIDDVARRAGVSVPTVSRVLTGAAKVSDEKRTRVLRAIEELNYRPSAAARALVARQPRIIAVVAGDTSRYGYAETIRGIEESARAAGYIVTITVVEPPNGDSVDHAVELLLEQSLAGVIVLKFDPAGVAALHLIPRDVPTVSISGVRETGVPQAVLDEAGAAEELVDYLLTLGHPTVHHVRVPPSRREDGRTTGWRRALKKAGAEVLTPLDATWEVESGLAIGRRLAETPGVSAVFCGNDEIAMGVIRGLADRGKAVPADVSVVGFDNHPLSAMWFPPLTTVDQDFVGLGTRAYGLLDDLINGRPVKKFSSVRPELVLRDSATAPAP